MSETLSPAGNGGLTPEQLTELRGALAELRSEIEARFGSRKDGSRSGPAARGFLDELGRGLRSGLQKLDPSGLYSGLRRLASAYGMEDRSLEVDEFGLDPLYLEKSRVLLDFLYDRWWRVQVTGAEKLPAGGRVLLVANRSGILPYDALMIAHAVERSHPSRHRPRFLMADWIATLPFSQPLLTRLGGVRACPENAERLLRGGHWVLTFPEGQKGAVKPFRERYQLQRFARGGFVSLALRLEATMVPVAVVGAEEVHPVLFHPTLPRRLFGIPLPVTPTFPLTGPLGLIPLPSQWRIRFGEPIRWDDLMREKADDALYVNRVRDQVRNTIQSLLEEEVHRRAGVFRG